MGYPVTIDFTIVQGDDFLHEFEFVDENCDPSPLSGTYHAQIRRRGIVLATFQCSYVSNVLSLIIPRATTALMVPVSDAVWDLEHHTTSSTFRTDIGGSVEIISDVTEV